VKRHGTDGGRFGKRGLQKQDGEMNSPLQQTKMAR